MSGINSIVGLNKVDLDYRPEIKNPTDKKDTGKVENGANDNIINANVNVEPAQEEIPPKKGEGRSVLQQLDVLLLNAANRSIAEDSAQKTRAMGKTLQELGVITKDEANNIATLSTVASGMLAALDKYTGAEIAGDAAKDAVKAAIDAQDDLSQALYALKNRLYKSDYVDCDTMDRFTELIFQCDRRETEINSIVLRMREIVQGNVVEGAKDDPKTKALLNAKFMDLMPREALLMHGTADSIAQMRKALDGQMRPLAEKLDAFAADHSKNLTAADIVELESSLATMKSAIANVRSNGVEVDGSKIGVDNSILREMENVLGEVSTKIADAKKHCVKIMRDAFIDDTKETLLPKGVPMPAHDAESPFGKYVDVVNRFTGLLRDHADGKLTEEALHDGVDDLNNDLGKVSLNASTLQQLGYSKEVAARMVDAITRLELFATQFLQLVKSTAQFASGGPDSMVTAGDIRRMMLGELSVSSVVEARARGFKASDVNTKADDANIVDSKPLGTGLTGSTYLLTTKSGEKLVFKPELDSCVGLNRMALGQNGSYSYSQTAVNLNFATYETAKFFGFEDMVVKYSVGSHNGQFGFFMEMAPGFSGEEFVDAEKDSADSVSPANIKTEIADQAERDRVKGCIAQKLNRLQWLDVITGQGDRHWNNYFLNIDKNTHQVTLKAIDNDASFSNDRIGVQKFKFSVSKSRHFKNAMKKICQIVHGENRWKAEYSKCMNSKAITQDRRTGVITVDMAKVNRQTREIGIALSALVNSQTIARPDAIDKAFYDKLMELDKNPGLKEDYLATVAPRLSGEALKAARLRLDDAIEYAKQLNDNDMVFDDTAWQTPAKLKSLIGIKSTVTVYASDGGSSKLGDNTPYVTDFLIRTCPSYYKRDYMNFLFAEKAKA